MSLPVTLRIDIKSRPAKKTIKIMIFQIPEDDFAVWDFLHSEENQLHIEKNHQKCMIFICFLQTYIINAMTFCGRKHN